MPSSPAELGKALTHDHLGHAYLLIGAETAAPVRAFLKQLYCPTACGECPSCQKLAHGTHPDLRWLRRTEKRIGIDQIRELQRDALYPPAESQRKVYVIEEAEVLSIEAQNSLLKLLEEPPEYVTFLLLVRSARLLPTILSRCQIIKLPEGSRAELEEKLRERGFSGEELNWLTALAQSHSECLAQLGPDECKPGLLTETRRLRSELAESEDQSLLQALQETENPLRRHEVILEFLQRLPHKRAHEVLELSLPLSKLASERLADFLKEAIIWYRDLLLLSRGRSTLIWNSEHREGLAATLSCYRSDQLARLVANLELSQMDFEGNANRQLLVESLLFKMAAASV